MTSEEILLKAADLIERDGWCQRTMVDEAGRRCAVGAIGAVSSISPEEGRAAKNRLRFIVGGSITFWNDDPGRTQDEVVAAMREAAKS